MKLDHKHLIIHATNCEWLPGEDDILKMENWIRDLVLKINMKILLGPWAVYSKAVGNRGYTGGVFIETSHIVMHTWDEEPFKTLQLDIYTCSYLDTNVVIKNLNIFNPNTIYTKYLDRNSGLTILPITWSNL
jgi:S-adenosylmethionine/arginine decarboxylase-like enzyme